MKRLMLIGVLLAILGARTAQASKREAHRVVARAIRHKPEVCSKIEWSVFLKGYHKAQMAFSREWKELGHQDRVDGRDVFAQLVRQCGERS